MKLFKFFLCANLFFIGNVLTAETPCPGEYNRATWTNCTGTLKDTEGEFAGDIYKGEFLNGLRHGNGTYLYPDGLSIVGVWEKDLPVFGREQLDNGAIYEGEYKNNKFHGKGTMIYKDGTEYSGNFRNGKAEGQGTIKFHYGRTYIGGMKNWNFHDKSFVFFEDGSVGFCIQRQQPSCVGSNANDVAINLQVTFDALPQAERKRIQTKLKKEGLYKFSVDGKWGRGTLKALVSFSSKNMGTVDIISVSKSRKLIDAVLK